MLIREHHDISHLSTMLIRELHDISHLSTMLIRELHDISHLSTMLIHELHDISHLSTMLIRELHDISHLSTMLIRELHDISHLSTMLIRELHDISHLSTMWIRELHDISPPIYFSWHTISRLLLTVFLSLATVQFFPLTNSLSSFLFLWWGVYPVAVLAPFVFVLLSYLLLFNECCYNSFSARRLLFYWFPILWLQ